MKSFKEMRTDPHRPSVMDPAEYVFVGAADDHPGDSYLEINHATLAQYGVETGSSDRYSSVNVPFYDARPDGRPNYRCHHCGKHGSNIRYFCFFLHKPSKQVIVVGQICAKKLSLGSREELDFQKRADDFRRMQQRRQWVDNHEAEYNYLRDYAEQHAAGGWYSEFFESLWEKIGQYGSLTDKQLSGLNRWMERGKPWERVSRPERDIDGDRHQGAVTRTQEEPTEAQLDYIANLAEQLEIDSPQVTTRIEASNKINELKVQLERSKASQPQHQEGEAMASEKQRSYINSLMEERQMAPEARQETRRQFDAGLTKSQASRWIEKLQQLPRIEE